DPGHQVRVAGNLVVVAHAHAPLVEVIAAVVDLLVEVAAEHVEVGVHRDRRIDADSVRVQVGAGGRIAAFNIVPGDALGGVGGERQGRGQDYSEQGALHGGSLVRMFSLLEGRPGRQG